MVSALRKAGILSCCSRCSSMSSGTERENSVSSSCILEPEGPVACGREEKGGQNWLLGKYLSSVLTCSLVERVRDREGCAACH